MKTKNNSTQAAKTLQSYMNATGLSVLDISKRTGLSRAFIYMILSGQCSVGFSSALKFKDALGISLDKWSSR